MQYGEKSEKGMLENLHKNIDGYNNKFGQNCVQSGSWNNSSVIAICTPVMQRVHQMCPNSAELVFMDSSGCLDKDNHRLFILMTHSAAGGLPLGCFITSSESLGAIKYGLELLKSLIKVPFYGVGYPQVFMTDDSKAERGAIAAVFPQSELMLCTFHVLQAVWRWAHESKHGLHVDQRPLLMKHVKAMMYASEKERMEQEYQILVNQEFVEKNQALTAYIQKLYQRNLEWCLCHRLHIMRGNNTNNYVESGFRIIKDNVFQRLKAYNLTQLTDFIVQRWSAHYIRKLLDISNNRYKPYQYTLNSFPATSIPAEDVELVGTGICI